MGGNLVGDAGALPPPPGDGHGAGVPVARHQPPALRHRLIHSAALEPGTGAAGLQGSSGRTNQLSTPGGVRTQQVHMAGG